MLDPADQENIIKYMPDASTLERISGLFGMLADATRVKIISALSMCEMCVNDMAVMLNINQTTLSHQLKLLKNLGVVKSIRDGKIIFYSLTTSRFSDLMLEGVNILF